MLRNPVIMILVNLLLLMLLLLWQLLLLFSIVVGVVFIIIFIVIACRCAGQAGVLGNMYGEKVYVCDKSMCARKAGVMEKQA